MTSYELLSGEKFMSCLLTRNFKEPTYTCLDIVHYIQECMVMAYQNKQMYQGNWSFTKDQIKAHRKQKFPSRLMTEIFCVKGIRLESIKFQMPDS